MRSAEGDGLSSTSPSARTSIQTVHYELCNCEPADIGDVLAKAWDEVRKAEINDGFLDTVEVIHNLIGDEH